MNTEAVRNTNTEEKTRKSIRQTWKRNLIVFISCMLIGAAAVSTPPIQASAKSTTVYITETGKCYHKSKKCRGLSRARKIYKTTLSDAKADGLRPCKICY